MSPVDDPFQPRIFCDSVIPCSLLPALCEARQGWCCRSPLGFGGAHGGGGGSCSTLGKREQQHRDLQGLFPAARGEPAALPCRFSCAVPEVPAQLSHAWGALQCALPSFPALPWQGAAGPGAWTSPMTGQTLVNDFSGNAEVKTERGKALPQRNKPK